MRLIIQDGGSPQDLIGGWPVPALPSYVGSRELGLLEREVGRYALGRVLGRSYLVAGHRGAGKTALVGRAVTLVSSATLRESVKETGSTIADAPFQRPLLVKLHGPTMLRQLQASSPTMADAPSPAEGAGSVADPSAAPVAGVPAALVQMTVGLYRALATEVATGYRAHARLTGAPDEAQELAAQLSLDLDVSADPAALNRYWSAIGRLRTGVLWPADADRTLARAGMGDQGLREITALATAGQAFEVCTGRVKYGTTAKESSKTSDSSEGAGSSDIKDALTRLSTLGVGALSGAAVLGASGGGSGGTIAALASGLAVWLLGSLTMKWSWSQSRTGDRTVDYSFIRDREPATLDRELPVVIARVRQAGLAPVFAIDELDKVPDAANELVGLVGRLKHLIADYGFFLFLVNRDCFEAMEAKVRTGAYPPEHTLFSDRLLLRPDPELTLAYLLERARGDPSDGQAGFARAVFSLVVMHESRLNLTDMMRQLSRATAGDGSIGDSADWTTQRRLVVASVQLAINEVLRTPALLERIGADPMFGQLAIDALYYPSRRWASGGGLDASQAELRRHLEERLAAGADGKPALRIPDDDLALLHRSVVKLLRLLGDLGSLRAIVTRKLVGDDAVDQPGDVRGADVVPADVDAICARQEDGSFRFLVTREGERLQTEPGEMSTEQRGEAEEVLVYAATFLALLEEREIPLDDLAATPLLNAIYMDGVQRAQRGLAAALAVNSFDADVEQHLSLLRRLQAEVARNAEALGTLLVLVASAAREAGSGRHTLRRVQRLIGPGRDPSAWLDGVKEAPARAVPASARALANWKESFEGKLLPALGGAGPPDEDFGLLEQPLRGYLTEGSPRHVRPSYRTFVRSASNTMPARAICADLAAMLIGDWSSLALQAMPADATPAEGPYWMLVAALRALGFGRVALLKLADPSLEPSLRKTGWRVGEGEDAVRRTFEIAGDVANAAPDAPPGVLVVDTTEQNIGAEKPSPRRGILALTEVGFERASTALRWLDAIGIFAVVADSRPESRDG